MAEDVTKWSKSQVYDYGRRKLGYGHYDPDRDGSFPKWMGLEAHKLHLVMRKRRVSNVEFVLCVDYCHATHRRIEHPVWVLRFLDDAREWKAASSPAPGSELGERIAEAVARERVLAAPDSPDWIDRLLRARGPYREEVLSEWRQLRQIP